MACEWPRGSKQLQQEENVNTTDEYTLQPWPERAAVMCAVIKSR
jgi:hypothetical protein